MEENQQNKKESQAIQIYNGFKNYIFPNEEIEILSENRLKICYSCPIRTDNKCDKNKGGCGCFLNLKTRSVNSSCPKQKW